MHSLVMLTALTATTGLFGGGRCHQRGHCYAPAPSCAAAPMYYQAGGGCAGTVAAAPQAVAAPQTAQVAQPTVYTASYYYAPSTCPNGNCYRR
jgi:hypothetical protein